jgi:hypothetical protein
MDITINKGTTEAIIDIEDLIILLEYKLVALNAYREQGEDVDQKVIDTLYGHSHLQQYLLSIRKE